VLTIIALAQLDDKFKDKIGEWKLIKQKATKWIKKAKKDISDSLENIMIDDQQKTNLLNFIEIENKASVSIKII
jgi:hypothetical protein